VNIRAHQFFDGLAALSPGETLGCYWSLNLIDWVESITASDAFHPINQIQAPIAPQGFCRGNSSKAVEKWGRSNVHRGMCCSSVKLGPEMLGKGLPVMLSTQSIKFKLQ